ncbi:MAG: RluA family pseudouridine synthase [Clostridium sp.]|jgi:23S rRNA pseudouridine1911/1915/1917 synthase|nr:RluA family pseudouridine synthase [Clostridium sp.]
MSEQQQNEQELFFRITEDLEGERLDKAAGMLAEAFSRTYLKKLTLEGRVLVNGAFEKCSYRVKDGDEVFIRLPDPIRLAVKAQDIPLDILYEDDDVIIINKPKGMVVHPAPGHMEGTLVNALMFHCKDQLSAINGILRPGIVHRIDMNTTGSVMACKNDLAHCSIAKQLKQHTVTRRYHAICDGVIPSDSGTIHKAIGRDPNNRFRMAVVPNGQGKDAITHYEVIRRFGQYTYIICTLETGRTHQIRVHLSSIGFPLLGDTLYGNPHPPFHLHGQTLHAKILGFEHPRTKEYLEIDTPLPEYFVSLLEKQLL